MWSILNSNRYFLPSERRNVSDMMIWILHSAVIADSKKLTISPRACIFGSSVSLEILLEKKIGTEGTWDRSEEMCRDVKASSCPYKREWPQLIHEPAEGTLPMHVGWFRPNKQIKLSSLAGAISLMVFGRIRYWTQWTSITLHVPNYLALCCLLKHRPEANGHSDMLFI